MKKLRIPRAIAILPAAMLIGFMVSCEGAVQSIPDSPVATAAEVGPEALSVGRQSRGRGFEAGTEKNHADRELRRQQRRERALEAGIEWTREDRELRRQQRREAGTEMTREERALRRQQRIEAGIEMSHGDREFRRQQRRERALEAGVERPNRESRRHHHG